MKRISLALVSLLGLLVAAPAALAQTSYNRFGPVDGILKGDDATYYTTAATSADVRALWSGTCDITTFLRGDGACAATSITGQALTRTNDTNVTLTLGGSPTTALVNPASLTLGWTGTLSAARGGTGVGSLGNITDVDDTNVTLTLGGTPTGAVINSTSFTLGWTGILAPARGGTNNGFTAFSGPTTSTKTFALPDASATILTSNSLVTVAQGGTGVGTITGPIRGNGTSAFTAAAAADIYGLWGGTCNAGTYLSGAGTCTTPAGTTSGANPTASVGLTAVNGVAGTFMRSDGAPALSQSIAPTWSGVHTWNSIANTGGIIASSVAPYNSWEETDQGTDLKRWRTGPISSVWSLQTLDDAFSTAKTALAVSRSTTAISNLTFGNATDNPTYTFAGTGLTSYTGRVGIVGDVGSNTMLDIQNTSAADGRTTIGFTNNRTTSRQWNLGIDTSGGVTKSFQIRDVTGGTTPFSLDTSGNLAITGDGSFTGRNFSAGGTGSTAVQLCHSSTGYGQIGVNVVCQAGGTENYSTTDVAGRIAFSSGTSRQWNFQSAASGTGGTGITWVNQASLNASGDLATAGAITSGTALVASNGGLTATGVVQTGSASNSRFQLNNSANAARLGFTHAAQGTNDFCNGTVSGDVCLGAAGGKLVFTGNDGSTAAATLTAAGVFTATSNIATTANVSGGSGTFTTATVGGSNVCRADGTNCPASGSGWNTISKAGNTSRASTVALTADPDLVTGALSGGSRYNISFCLRFNGTTTGTQGFKFVINRTGVGSNSLFWGGTQLLGTTPTAIVGAGGNSPGTTTGQLTFATIDVSGAVTFACGQGMVDAASGVSFAVEWAQNSSNVNNTNLLGGSWIRWQAVN